MIRQQLKPEQRNLRKDLALARYPRPQHMIKRRNPIRRHQQQDRRQPRKGHAPCPARSAAKNQDSVVSKTDKEEALSVSRPYVPGVKF